MGRSRGGTPEGDRARGFQLRRRRHRPGAARRAFGRRRHRRHGPLFLQAPDGRGAGRVVHAHRQQQLAALLLLQHALDVGRVGLRTGVPRLGRQGHADARGGEVHPQQPDGDVPMPDARRKPLRSAPRLRRNPALRAFARRHGRRGQHLQLCREGLQPPARRLPRRGHRGCVQTATVLGEDRRGDYPPRRRSPRRQGHHAPRGRGLRFVPPAAGPLHRSRIRLPESRTGSHRLFQSHKRTPKPCARSC